MTPQMGLPLERCQAVRVSTPCRLHFGLLALNRQEDERQYGGAGVMVRRPRITLRAMVDETGDGFTATGPMAAQAAAFASQFIQQARAGGQWEPVAAGRLVVEEAPRPHTGLGTGTQLGMAVAQALAVLSGQMDLDVPALASLVGRGRRSAIGAYGFAQGGFIVEGGKLDPTRLSPLLMRHPFPADWRLVMVQPRKLEGLAGQREVQAFAQMPRIDGQTTAAMCRLVLLGLTPAMLEGDLPAFGEALYELQRLVGQCFIAAQGGIYAHRMLQEMVDQLREWGVRGVGQSSWGPTLYAVVGDEDHAHHLAGRLAQAFGLSSGEVIISGADNQGGECQLCDAQGRFLTTSRAYGTMPPSPA